MSDSTTPTETAEGLSDRMTGELGGRKHYTVEMVERFYWEGFYDNPCDEDTRFHVAFLLAEIGRLAAEAKTKNALFGHLRSGLRVLQSESTSLGCATRSTRIDDLVSRIDAHLGEVS